MIVTDKVQAYMIPPDQIP